MRQCWNERKEAETRIDTELSGIVHRGDAMGDVDARVRKVALGYSDNKAYDLTSSAYRDASYGHRKTENSEDQRYPC